MVAAVAALAPVGMFAAPAWAAETTVTYSIAIDSVNKYYHLIGSDGTQSPERFSPVDPTRDKTFTLGGVTLRLVSNSMLSAGLDQVAKDITGYERSFNNAQLDVTVASTNRYIRHVELIGCGESNFKKVRTSREADANARTCSLSWESVHTGGTFDGSLCAIAVTFSDTQKTFSVNTTAGVTGSGTVTASPNSGLVGGETVTLTAKPATGFYLASPLTAKDDRDRDVPIYDDDTFTMPIRDVTVSAVFAAASYTVVFDPNGGTGKMEDKTYSYDTTETLPVCGFTRSGHYFTGWETQPGGTGVSRDPGGSAGGLAEQDGATITLYAQWRKNSASAPLEINTLADLNDLADRVNAGTDMGGLYFKQTAPITGFKKTIGTEGKPFRGVYDGGGHTLTVTLTDGNYCAPFGYLDGATVKNLTVEGSASTNGWRVAGLAAHISGSVSIENCTVTATIEGKDKTGRLGGFVGENAGTLTLTDCAFQGSLTGSTNDGSGFVCSDPHSVAILTGCTFAPFTVSLSSIDASTYTFASDGTAKDLSLTRCYYTRALGLEQGTHIYTDTTALANKVIGHVTLGGTTYHIPVDVKVWSRYTYTGENIHPEPTVTAYDGTVLTKDTDYTVSYSSSNDNNQGDYTLTVSGNGSSYTGSQTCNYAVVDISGHWTDHRAASLTEKDGVIEIASAEELALLAFNVNSGTSYAKKRIHLMADIDLSAHYWTPIGNGNPGNPFDGHFYGNGHVIKGLTTEEVGDYHGLFGTIFAHGGYLDGDDVTIEGIVLENCDVNGTNYVGAIVGNAIYSSQFYKPYVQNCLILGGSVSGTDNVNTFCGNNISTTYSCYYVNVNVTGAGDNGTQGYTVSFNGGVSAAKATGSNGVFHQGVLYAGKGEDVKFTLTSRSAGKLVDSVTYNDGSTHSIPPTDGVYSFTMPEDNVTVTATLAACALDGSGTAGSPYVIGSDGDWTYVANHPGLYDKNFRLGNNISVTHSLGTKETPFSGTFDGDGKTLTVNLTNDGGEYTAPFRFVNGAAIRNLRTAGDVKGGDKKYASGLIGSSAGSVSIQNCRVSVTISSTLNDDGTHGGLIAMTNGETGITGCVFDGSITGPSTHSCGGFVGWRNAGVLTITNSLFAPLPIGIINDSRSATFSRANTAEGTTVTNCYYLTALGTEQGAKAYSVTAGTNVTGINPGTGTQYGVSGITAYANGLTFGGTLYAGAGEELSLNLHHATVPAGKAFDGYSVSAGKIEGTENPYTLTMPATGMTVGVTVSAAFRDMEQVATPEISPEGGSYTGVKSVTITCATEGATIRYTTNGTKPSANSAEYTGKITISKSGKLRAIAVKDGMLDSAEASVEYDITPENYALVVTAPTFDNVTYGYAQPAAKAITIENVGNLDAAVSGVALDDTGKQYFKLNKETSATIAASATDSTTYTVRPNAGLAAGTYKATITVTYNGGATAEDTVSFTVNKATPAHTPTQEPNPTSKPGGNGGSDDKGNGDDNGDTPDDKPNTKPDNGNGNGNGGTPDDKPNTDPDNGNGNDNGDTPDDKPNTEPDNGNGNDNGDTPDDKPDTEPEKTEEQKATEKQAKELVSNMDKTVANSEAGAEMKKVLQDTTDTNKQAAAVDVVNTLNDSLSSEEIAGLSKKDIESAVTNKQKEKAAAEKETTQNGGKVDDAKTPAGTDLFDNSDTVSPAVKKANGELSVKPKFTAPAPLPESDIKKIGEKLANRIGTKEIMSGGIHVNTTEEDKDLDKQATKLEDLIKLIVDTLAKITNTAIGKGAAVTVAGANERGLVLATLLPEITVDADGYYPMGVNLRNVTPGRVLSFWPSADYIDRYAAGEVGEYDAYFLDEDDNVVTKVTGDASKMKVVPYLEKGKTYDTAFIVVNATENDLKALETLATELNSGSNDSPTSDSPTSDKGSGGCDAGLGVVGLLALAGLMAARKR